MLGVVGQQSCVCFLETRRQQLQLKTQWRALNRVLQGFASSRAGRDNVNCCRSNFEFASLTNVYTHNSLKPSIGKPILPFVTQHQPSFPSLKNILMTTDREPTSS